MVEFLVIFSVAAAGALVRLSADPLLKTVARRTQSATLTLGSVRGDYAPAAPPVDPVASFAFTLTGYGVVSLALVSALPGPMALQRTVLAFALLCVGGLLGEISSTGTTTSLPNIDSEQESNPPRRPISLGLSLALTLTLNLSFAVLSYGQGLLEIVPPRKPSGAADTAVLIRHPPDQPAAQPVSGSLPPR